MSSEPFWREHGPALGAGVVAVAVIGLAAFLLTRSDGQPVRKVPEVMMVKLQPLPPPPPPPPPPPKIEQPKMVEQTPVKMDEPRPEKPMDKPKAEPPKADAPPPGPLAMDAKGEGPGDAFNLGGRPGGNGLLGGEGGGSRWGWYAAIVQNQIEDAMRRNGKTKNASARAELRLWSDAAGHIERVQLASSTGDAEVDRAVEHEVLAGMTLRQPPPKDMPMPIVVRMTARRPS